MSNCLRKLKRTYQKKIITEFQKETKWSDLQIIGLCATMKTKTGLSGKVDAIMEIQLKAMEEKFAGAKVVKNDDIEDGIVIDSMGAHNG